MSKNLLKFSEEDKRVAVAFLITIILIVAYLHWQGRDDDLGLPRDGNPSYLEDQIDPNF